MRNTLHRGSFEKGRLNMSKINPIQRKTTLKWTSNGELSSIDKARILEKLTDKELTECELACDLEKSNKIV